MKLGKLQTQATLQPARQKVQTDNSRARANDNPTGQGPDIRKLIDRINQAEIDPRKKTKLASRIRNYIAENKQDESPGFNPRKVFERIKNSDLEAADKRALVERLQNFVEEQNSSTATESREEVSPELARRRKTIVA